MFYFFKKGKCIIEHTIRLAIWALLTLYSALGANPSIIRLFHKLFSSPELLLDLCVNTVNSARVDKF